MLSALARLFNSPSQRKAYEAYAQLVEKAREPLFYEQCAVPDTLDGRFEMILLQLFLYQRKAFSTSDNPETQRFCRAIAEAFFQDMDRSLREIGISDTGVGKRIKAIGRAYFGRLQNYEEAMSNDEALKNALLRNVYATVEKPTTEQLEKLVLYIRSVA